MTEQEIRSLQARADSLGFVLETRELQIKDISMRLDLREKRNTYLKEILWQTWKCFSEEGAEATKPFLRNICINEKIMDENGGRISSQE